MIFVDCSNQTNSKPMIQTTYSAIEVDGKNWLAPEPLAERPEIRTNTNGEWPGISDWIKIKEECAGKLKCRIGLKEAIDFKLIREVLTPNDKWIKAIRREWWEILPEDRKRIVAVPINTDPMQDEDTMWYIAFETAYVEFKEQCDKAESWQPAIDHVKKSFTIKRKQ